MNREQIRNAVSDRFNLGGIITENITDFIIDEILDQSGDGQIEKITAKECFLAILTGVTNASIKKELIDCNLIAEWSHEAAKAFNNYNPE